MQDEIYTQVATYWGVPVIDGYGTRSFGAPEKILVRWEERTGLSIYKNGEEINSRAIVYVQKRLAIGGTLALGDYAKCTTVTDPTTLESAYLIQDFKEVPSVDGSTILRKAFL